jgi:hypothetical protein
MAKCLGDAFQQSSIEKLGLNRSFRKGIKLKNMRKHEQMLESDGVAIQKLWKFKDIRRKLKKVEYFASNRQKKMFKEILKDLGISGFKISH